MIAAHRPIVLALLALYGLALSVGCDSDRPSPDITADSVLIVDQSVDLPSDPDGAIDVAPEIGTPDATDPQDLSITETSDAEPDLHDHDEFAPSDLLGDQPADMEAADTTPDVSQGDTPVNDLVSDSSSDSAHAMADDQNETAEPDGAVDDQGADDSTPQDLDDASAAQDQPVDQPGASDVPDSTADQNDGADDDDGADQWQTLWIEDTLRDFPPLLSQLGLFPNLTDRKSVDSRVIYYEPKYPVWTDGSGKSRWIYLPTGVTVDNTSRAWIYANGTAFFKHFEFPGQPVETRIYRRRAGEWETAVYKWNSDGTEAHLLDAEVPTPVAIVGRPELNYLIPSRYNCAKCHVDNVVHDGLRDVRVYPIGFDELRLNSVLPGQQKTQIELLAAAGVFKKPLTYPLESIPGNEIEVKAKGYLHGNCAHCHNGFKFDARYAWLEATTITGDKLIVPQDPESSLIFIATVRWENQQVFDMPQLGVSLVDPSLEKTLKEYINSLPIQ